LEDFQKDPKTKAQYFFVAHRGYTPRIMKSRTSF